MKGSKNWLIFFEYLPTGSKNGLDFVSGNGLETVF